MRGPAHDERLLNLARNRGGEGGFGHSYPFACFVKRSVFPVSRNAGCAAAAWEGLPRFTDITEHPTREGKVYCAVVLDTFSRPVVGWSIDASPTASLVTSALGMAIDQRQPGDSTVIHSDQGTQGGFNRSSQHLRMMEVWTASFDGLCW